METKHALSETTHQVRSTDGTVIGYRQMGTGAGLLVLHGGGRASQHYRLLAQQLADTYTLYIPDRRGRGLSGRIGANYNVAQMCEDVQALMTATGAKHVFGHSGGGIIALEAALRLPIETLLLYEPAVSINGSLPTAWLSDYETALARNNPALAMAIFLKALDMNWMSKLPRWVLTSIFSLMLRGNERDEIVELLQTIVPEMNAVKALDSTHERYRTISTRTLLLGGGKSPAFLLNVLPILAETLPHARYIELAGLDHSSPEEEGAVIVAQTIRQFLTEASLAAVAS